MCIYASLLILYRIENDELFYHGFDNYLKHAFPEDELRPLNCSPLTRDRANPGRFELNDPLGNYSLTLVDTLSTLAVIASSGEEPERKKSFTHFQDGVTALVELYGDGSEGTNGQGTKSRGFDLDSKVSVFETVIRGVGGLLSAHLFAVGDLPIKDYRIAEHLVTLRSGQQGIQWSSKFVYDGQLLRLATDLAGRLLPAFATSTGIPYPRVNLRHGIPFYTNSCGHYGELCHPDDDLQCPVQAPSSAEVTRTCTAGAGTLMLEFIVLSRLTGNYSFENAAKRAFWSIWERRTSIDLVGSDIDAETGQWLSAYTGLGAGVDSFYEYAFKAYVLLSGAEEPMVGLESPGSNLAAFYPPPLRKKHHQPESFLRVWQKSHEAINRHLRRGDTYGYPHFIQGDAFNGAARAIWMDALSAFYPGLLTLAGHVDEATENHVLFTALWSRYSALPERWSVASGDIEHGLGWWLGRPEFIESNFYLYRATRDPWYLHVGEMTLKDIKRLCWVPCGLSGIQDVRTLERNNRMESFFLGETAKYLHLLFNSDHPLNNMDSSFVFSTEGHPLIIPRDFRKMDGLGKSTKRRKVVMEQCEVPKLNLPFSVSNVAARTNLFHAASLARLQLEPKIAIGRSNSKSPTLLTSERSPTNHTFFPWTLPSTLIPSNGTSALQSLRPTFDITFPTISNINLASSIPSRTSQGVLIGSLSGARLGMIQDIPALHGNGATKDLYRIHSINHIPLGRDENVFMGRDTIAAVVKATDPLFARVEDTVLFDLAVDLSPRTAISLPIQTLMELNSFQDMEPPLIDTAGVVASLNADNDLVIMENILKDRLEELGSNGPETPALKNLMRYLSRMNPSISLESVLKQTPKRTSQIPLLSRTFLPAITAQGGGAAQLPKLPDVKLSDFSGKSSTSALPWTKIHIAGNGCTPLAAHIPRNHQVLILKRGGCSFIEKLANIPSFPPSELSLQLVIIVSFAPGDSVDETELQQLNGRNLIRPLLAEAQITKSGIPRRNAIPLVMIGGGDRVWNDITQGRWRGIGIRRRYSVESGGTRIGNLVVL